MLQNVKHSDQAISLCRQADIIIVKLNPRPLARKAQNLLTSQVDIHRIDASRGLGREFINDKTISATEIKYLDSGPKNIKGAGYGTQGLDSGQFPGMTVACRVMGFTEIHVDWCRVKDELWVMNFHQGRSDTRGTPANYSSSILSSPLLVTMVTDTCIEHSRHGSSRDRPGCRSRKKRHCR